MNATTLYSDAGRVKRITRLVEVLPVRFQDEIERQLERLVMTCEASTVVERNSRQHCRYTRDYRRNQEYQSRAMSIVTVFDTNVWVSYFLNRQLEELVALKYDRDICLVRSADTLRELQLVAN